MRYFSPEEAVKFLADEHKLKITTATLRAYRTKGHGGPRFAIPVRAVEYSEADLVEWINERRSKTFSNSTEAKIERHQRLVAPAPKPAAKAAHKAQARP